jgi:hypothetical protein
LIDAEQSEAGGTNCRIVARAGAGSLRPLRAAEDPKRKPNSVCLVWVVIQHVSYHGRGGIEPALHRAGLEAVD